MGIENFGTIENIQGRASAPRQLADSEDISGGVEAQLGNYSRLTLFLDVEGAVDIEIEFSPDGENWYSPVTDSPISYDSATTDVLEIGYVADRLRLTATDGTTVSAQVYEVV